MEEARQYSAVITLGFDPGGGDSFGCAVVTDGDAVSATTGSVDEAVDWVVSQLFGRTPNGAGIDTLLFWQTTRSGWRGADEYLRARFPARRNSVLCSNGLYGSMAVQGATLAVRLRERWPSLFLTETHPKVLWEHLASGIPYPREPEPSHPAVLWLSEALETEINPTNEHEFDALLSGWAADRACRGMWTLDLATIEARHQRSANVSLVADVHYLWPE
ncbi:hypothetical protein [Brevundimonas sp.]|uniref:hypothetical protein n=1 Tax=Brevundimonas sp. TaxID=1871086 RepID=UPI00286AD688|nr:hypothetical protein [Brevundimonas sp.]